MLPKFKVQEDWNSEDVTVYFEEKISESLHEYMCDELGKAVSTLNEDTRTIYHLESIINTIFSAAATGGKLKKSNGLWTLHRLVL